MTEIYCLRGGELPQVGWVKSSYSAPLGSCFEVLSLQSGEVAIRHSKNPQGPALIFTGDEWTAFKRGVSAGEFG